MRFMSVLLIAWIGIAIPSFAAIYMQQDSSGNITYTDIPSPNAKPITATEENVATSSVPQAPASKVAPAKPEAVKAPIQTDQDQTPKPEASAEVGPVKIQPAEDENARTDYKTFELKSPQNQETIQNQPTINVEIGIDPPLRKGDRIQVLVDGKLWGEPSNSPKISISGVERGSHEIYAVLINKDGRILKQTAMHTIFVHHASVNTLPKNKTVPNLP